MKTAILPVGSAQPLSSRRHPAVVLPFERVRRIPAGLPILLAVLGFIIWLAGSMVLIQSLIRWWADLEISAFQSGYAAYLN
jgi:hypothetical protein